MATTKRATKAEAVEQIAAILAQFPGHIADAMAGDAMDHAEYLRAVKRETRNWPKFNKADGVNRTWAEHIDYCREAGEWRDEWPTPPEPK